MWLALMDPRWTEKPHTEEEQERTWRYNIFQLARLFHRLPEEIEAELTPEWYEDALLFLSTEAVVQKGTPNG